MQQINPEINALRTFLVSTNPAISKDRREKISTQLAEQNRIDNELRRLKTNHQLLISKATALSSAGKPEEVEAVSKQIERSLAEIEEVEKKSTKQNTENVELVYQLNAATEKEKKAAGNEASEEEVGEKQGDGTAAENASPAAEGEGETTTGSHERSAGGGFARNLNHQNGGQMVAPPQAKQTKTKYVGNMVNVPGFGCISDTEAMKLRAGFAGVMADFTAPEQGHHTGVESHMRSMYQGADPNEYKKAWGNLYKREGATHLTIPFEAVQHFFPSSQADLQATSEGLGKYLGVRSQQRAVDLSDIDDAVPKMVLGYEQLQLQKPLITQLKSINHYYEKAIQNIPIFNSTSDLQNIVPEGTDAPEINSSLANKELQPNRLHFYLSVGRDTMLGSGNFDYFGKLKMELAKQMMIYIDRAVLSNTLTDNGKAKVGFLNTSGITEVELGTNGGTLTLQKLQALQNAITAHNNDIGECWWMCASSIPNEILRLLSGLNTGFMFNPTSFEGRDMPGTYWPFLASKMIVNNTMPTNGSKGSGTNLQSIAYLNPSTIHMGSFGEVTMRMDPYSEMRSARVRIHIECWKDWTLGRENSFGLIDDVLVSS